MAAGFPDRLCPRRGPVGSVGTHRNGADGRGDHDEPQRKSVWLWKTYTCGAPVGDHRSPSGRLPRSGANPDCYGHGYLTAEPGIANTYCCRYPYSDTYAIPLANATSNRHGDVAATHGDTYAHTNSNAYAQPHPGQAGHHRRPARHP